MVSGAKGRGPIHQCEMRATQLVAWLRGSVRARLAMYKISQIDTGYMWPWYCAYCQGTSACGGRKYHLELEIELDLDK